MGIDVAWHISDNVRAACASTRSSAAPAAPRVPAVQELLFFNSLKMKMSVILGITQMTFGLILKVLNAIHFKSAADLWLEAVPQVRGAPRCPPPPPPRTSS